MKVVVTGASGFIGGAVARTLIGHGHEVWSISRSFPADIGIPREQHIAAEIADVRARDVPSDFESIVHCAGLAAPGEALASPPDAMRANTVGTARILEIARLRSIPLVLASSVYVYDGCGAPPWHEELELRPISPLGVSKLGAEAISRAYWSCFGVAVSALRFFTVFGPGARSSQFIPSAIRKIAAAERTASFGSGDATRDFVYIDDVVAAIIAAMKFTHERRGFEVINIASGEERSIRQAVDIIRSTLGKTSVEVLYERVPPRADEQNRASRHAAVIGKAERLLSWRPRVSFDEGIRRTCEAVLAAEGRGPRER